MVRLAALIEDLFGRFGQEDTSNAFWEVAFNWADSNRESLRNNVRSVAGNLRKKPIESDDEADDIIDHVIYFILGKVDISSAMARSLFSKLEDPGPHEDRDTIIAKFVNSYLNDARLFNLWERNVEDGYLDWESRPVKTLRQISSIMTKLKQIEINQRKIFASIFKA